MNFTVASTKLTCFSAWYNIVDAVLILSLILAALIANLLVLIVIGRSPAFRTSANVYVACLSCADIAICVAPLPMSFAFYVCNWVLLGREKMIFAVLDILSSTASITSLAAIACDRYYAIVCPYTYEKVGTVYLAIVICLIVWAYGIAVAIVQLFMSVRDYRILMVIATYIFPMLLMIACYTRIGLIAKHHSRQILSLQVKQRSSRILPYAAANANQAFVAVPQVPRSRFKQARTGNIAVINQDDTICHNGDTNGSGSELSRETHVGENRCTNVKCETTSGQNSLYQNFIRIGHEERNEPLSLDPLQRGQQTINEETLSIVTPTARNFSDLAQTRDLPKNTRMQNGFRRKTLRLKKQMRKLRTELKASLTLAVVMGSLLCLWTPFMAVNLRIYICKDCEISHLGVKYTKLLHYFSSALNPAIYVLLNRGWRQAIKKLLAEFQSRLLCMARKRRVRPLQFKTGASLAVGKTRYRTRKSEISLSQHTS